MSTTAIFTQLNAGSKIIGQAAETTILASALKTTILLPRMIYATPGDRHIIRLVKWINRLPVLPVFGNGGLLQQSVHVTDVAWPVVQLLESIATSNHQFNISGAEPLTYKEAVCVTAQALFRRVQSLHIPAQFMVDLLDLIERFGITLSIKAEQIRRLNEDKAFSHAEARDAFGYAPIAFEEGIRQEVALFRAGRDELNT